MDCREQCWNIYIELKHSQFYYYFYKARCEVISKAISIFLFITSLSCVSAWTIWASIPYIWGTIIVLSQIIQALSFFFPYEKQLISLKYLLPELQKICSKAERMWIESELENKFDYKKFWVLSNEIDSLEEKYTVDVPFPIRKCCEKLAEKENVNYFNFKFNCGGIQNVK